MTVIAVAVKTPELVQGPAREALEWGQGPLRGGPHRGKRGRGREEQTSWDPTSAVTGTFGLTAVHPENSSWVGVKYFPVFIINFIITFIISALLRLCLQG